MLLEFLLVYVAFLRAGDLWQCLSRFKNVCPICGRTESLILLDFEKVSLALNQPQQCDLFTLPDLSVPSILFSYLSAQIYTGIPVDHLRLMKNRAIIIIRALYEYLFNETPTFYVESRQYPHFHPLVMSYLDPEVFNIVFSSNEKFLNYMTLFPNALSFFYSLPLDFIRFECACLICHRTLPIFTRENTLFLTNT
jgi:hypothetical protein